ncbi:MAG: fused MFS/spermidine synthase [Chloroflexi bacterium]|nr:fused MFS/spermidine synthase [Chloroflexota bacterium]
MKYLSLLVFVTGAATLGVELSASRLLEPAFGNNQIVWAALIGMILFYLALGAWLGGKLADRFPHRQGLETTIIFGALGVALVPTLSPRVLHWAATGLDTFNPGLLVGALVAVLVLFSLPVILLGTVSPWAVRLAVKDVAQSGQTAGRLYALATAGSLVGTFLPVLWLIPTYGTRWTFYLLALTLLIIVSVGSIRQRYRWLPLLSLIGVLLLALFVQPGSSIRAGWDDSKNGKIIYEDESAYNYIAVRQWGSERHLKLNDGIGIHSVYHPQMLLSDGIWDYFLLAPLFKPPTTPLVAPKNLLLIGLAAGTISELFTNIYGPLPITGIELDPEIIAVGQRYFHMNQPNLTPIAADGRRWLLQQPSSARWDLIAVDAYRPPYIPFHLTTLEFFQLVRSHLTDQGILAINVGRTASDFALVDALSKTVGQVFPSVYLIDQPGPADNLSNSLLVATVQPTQLTNFTTNVAALPNHFPVEFRQFAQTTTTQARRAATPAATTPIFTDDRAPVEQVVHRIIWKFLSNAQ